MFVVYDTENPATLFESNNKFQTLSEAIKYCGYWLGELISLPENWSGEIYEYHQNAFIEIREE